MDESATGSVNLWSERAPWHPHSGGRAVSSAEAEVTLVHVDSVEVRHSPRARRWRLEAPWDEPARLTVPQQTSRAEVERILAEKRSWIEAQRRRQVPRLCLDPSAVSESEARTAARELVSALAEEEAERIGVEYHRIRIGGQRTLWGSCSPAGTLSFNWRLVLAPLEVLDYVVVHELCHLRVPNHSRRFWALVERHRGHWRQQRDWLRDHGPELLAFRPPN
jgi:predicted metal-dependent hydrolase